MRERLLASSMICGAVLGFASTASAQTPAAPATGGAEVSEVVVTGTRIPTPNLTSVSPVAAVSQEDIKQQGVTRIEDLVNSLPQAAASFGGNLSNGATGAANVNLRGLGGQRTLVLIDGRRLLPGDPTQNGNEEADINFIPAALIDRFEVLTGGASAVYGADAVAGVVNFIMLKNFEGVRVDATTSFYQHSQHSDGIASIVAAKHATNPAQFNVPGDETDGSATDVTLVIGANAPDGKGNVTAYAGYRHLDPVLQAARDFSACTLNSGTKFSCGGSSTSATGRFLTGGGAGDGDFTVQGDQFVPFVSSRDQFNFAPANYFQRPDERYTFGAFAHYEINKSLDVYSQLMFMDDRSLAQIAPSGIFFANLAVNCDNPLLSAQQSAAICDPSIDQDPATPGIQTAADEGNNAILSIGRRNVEGGGRVADFRHTDYRGVVGVRGELSDAWNYDAYAQFSRGVYAQHYLHEFSLARSANALQAVRDPTTGNIVCKAFLSGADLSCVPYNPFTNGGVTAAQLNYIQVSGFQQGQTEEVVADASVNGDLGKYGIKSPWASDGVGVAFGAEYRYESSDLQVDTEFATGDLAGQGGPTQNTSGSYDVYELFGEARVPIVQDMPWIKALTLELGYRFSDYNLGFTTNTYKVGGDWSPTDDLRFRASYQRAVRAPNVQELFRPSFVQLDGNTDPCAGANPLANDPNATLANCLRTGITAAQYGNVLENPASQYNGFTGGNPHLDPEEADTYSVGLVLTPHWVPGLTASLDWWDIKVSKVIGTIGADVTLQRCLTSGDPTFCSLIHRAPGTGSLWLTPSGFVSDTNFNLGSIETRGIDYELNYRTNFADLGMGDYGGLAVNFTGSWTDEYLTETLPGDQKYDCAGWYGPSCASTGGVPAPRWRNRLRVTWSTPWKVQASATWRYVSSVRLGTDLQPATSPATDLHLGSRNYLDLAASWNVRDNVTLRAGVTNVLDKDPPILGQSNCPSVFCSGNTFPQVYDTLGRNFFFNVTADF